MLPFAPSASARACRPRWRISLSSTIALSPAIALSVMVTTSACVVRGHVGEANLDEDAATTGAATTTTAATTEALASSGESETAARDPQTESGESSTTVDEPDTAHFDVGASPDIPYETTGDPTIDVVDCCAPNNAPGCPDPEIEACVCVMDPYCCDVVWDDACVEIATWSDCEACIAPEPPPPDDCCLGQGGRGCADKGVQSCVCEMDPYCCDVAWDEYCAEQVDSYGCGACA